jgi:hypothetical protein
MKITEAKPGEFALWLHSNEVLDSRFVTEAYVLFGARPKQAKEFSSVFFYAIRDLAAKKWKMHKEQSERGRQAGLKSAEWHKKQKELKNQSPLNGG